ncbi:hypothetical protein [Thermoactinospora rubra]|uniref:hypothetical protein n=1 Tax=Thermoactinospora rubra TaxID=1088767 RepID=UPI000A0F98E0|nr:hypothetical protein [Thermoactinospora rubra]
MPAFELRHDPHLGDRVCPHPLRRALADLVPGSRRVPWPTWLDPGPRLLREVLDLARLQTARCLAVLSWLAGADPPDGHQAAHAAMTLLQIHDRHPEARPAMAAAWAAAKVGADWCKAAELRAAYARPAPVFTYPRAADPPPLGVRPWIERLFRLRRLH